MEYVCANCGIAIRWVPTVKDGTPYCCPGCSQGGPCDCDYSRLPQESDKTAIVIASPSIPQDKLREAIPTKFGDCPGKKRLAMTSWEDSYGGE